MLSVQGVRHSKLSVLIILNEGIEASGVHLCLQNDLALFYIIGVDFHDTDVLSVNRSVEEVKIVFVIDEITS